MSGVKRYEFGGHCHDADRCEMSMREADDGGFVLADAYDALQAQCERLQAHTDFLERENRSLTTQVDIAAGQWKLERDLASDRAQQNTTLLQRERELVVLLQREMPFAVAEGRQSWAADARAALSVSP